MSSPSKPSGPKQNYRDVLRLFAETVEIPLNTVIEAVRTAIKNNLVARDQNLGQQSGWKVEKKVDDLIKDIQWREKPKKSEVGLTTGILSVAELNLNIRYPDAREPKTLTDVNIPPEAPRPGKKRRRSATTVDGPAIAESNRERVQFQHSVESSHELGISVSRSSIDETGSAWHEPCNRS